jgi:serine/threonine protein kinase
MELEQLINEETVKGLGLNLKRCLGSGGWGKVYIVTNQRGNQFVAKFSKVGEFEKLSSESTNSLIPIEINYLGNDQKEISISLKNGDKKNYYLDDYTFSKYYSLLFESQCLSICNQNNIGNINQFREFQHFSVDKFVGNVSLTEYTKDSECLYHLLCEDKLEPKIRYKIINELAKTVYELSQYVGITHRDIKPKNILMCPDNSIQLIDFGVSTFNEKFNQIDLSSQQIPSYFKLLLNHAMEHENGHYGTLGFVAPETEINSRMDYFSLGFTVCAILTGNRIPQNYSVDTDSPSSLIVDYDNNDRIKTLDLLHKYKVQTKMIEAIGELIWEDPTKRDIFPLIQISNEYYQRYDELQRKSKQFITYGINKIKNLFSS